jgi:hypothetical protein
MVPISGPSVASRKDSITSPSDEKVGRRSLELPKVTTVEDEGEGQTKTESDQP